MTERRPSDSSVPEIANCEPEGGGANDPLGYSTCRTWLDAGLSPFEALQAATISGVQSLSGDYDSFEVGNAEDLVMLDENPLEDIRRTRDIRVDVKKGNLLRRKR